MDKTLSRRQMALLCLGLLLALAFGGAWQALAWSRTQLDTGALVCADTLRLHIQAESDSIADQSAKLHVRDAVLAYMDAACPAQTKADALCWASGHLFELQLTARHALAALGIRAPVQVRLVNMYFAPGAMVPALCPPGGTMPCASTSARVQAATGGVCSTRACAALPAADTPCRRKTTSSAGTISSG